MADLTEFARLIELMNQSNQFDRSNGSNQPKKHKQLDTSSR